MASVRRALAISFASGYTMLVIQFASTVILARLLTPEQIGIFSIASVFVAVAQIIRDFGVGPFLIQTRELTDDHVRAAFTITISVAWTLALLLYLVSGRIADFYSQPGVEPVMQLLAFNFLLIPFGSVVRSVWQRRLDMKPIYIVTLVSTLVQAGVSVLFAWLGYGYMALAIGAVTSAIAMIVATIMLRPKDLPWLPGIHKVREVLGFSRYLVGGEVVREAATGAPDMIIGKVLNAESVGYFGKAFGTIQIFQHLVMRGIYPVLLPHISQHVREDGDTREKYLHALSLLTALAWPFFAFLAIFAGQVIHVLYGHQWDQSIPLVRIMAFYGFCFALLALNPVMLIAKSEVRRVFRLTLVVEPVKIILMLLLAPRGIEMAAIALALGTFVQWLLQVRYFYPHIPVRIGSVMRRLIPSTLVMVACGLTGIGLQYLPGFHEFGELSQLVIAMVATGLVWTATLAILRHPAFHEIRRIVKRVVEFRPDAESV